MSVIAGFLEFMGIALIFPLILLLLQTANIKIKHIIRIFFFIKRFYINTLKKNITFYVVKHIGFPKQMWLILRT